MNDKLASVVREYLPFTVELAANATMLNDAVRVRQSAYSRHLPEVAKSMDTAETWDFNDGAVVFVARTKLDNEPLGSMRIHTNETAPLPLEQSFALPQEFSGQLLAEATRLAVMRDSAGSLAKFALFKAYLYYCFAKKVDSMVITARSPLDRMYERLCFTDVGEKGAYIPMAHVGGIPHRVMHLAVDKVEPKWAEGHPLFNFMFKTEHPDIKAGVSAASLTDSAIDSCEISPA
jgi:predicted GNAT family N-acyltransferase